MTVVAEREHITLRKQVQPLGGTGWFLLGAASGALFAMLFDMDNGRRRRALVRDKSVRARSDFRRATDRRSRNLANHLKGAMAQAARLFEGEAEIDDHKLMQRVRSDFGRVVRHSKSIDVSAEKGVITLCGPILADEFDALINHVKNVRGVRRIIDRLEIHDRPDRISGLQGEGKPYIQDHPH